MSNGDPVCWYCGRYLSLHTETGREVCRLMNQWGVPKAVVMTTYGGMDEMFPAEMTNALVEINRRLDELDRKIDDVRRVASVEPKTQGGAHG